MTARERLRMIVRLFAGSRRTLVVSTAAAALQAVLLLPMAAIVADVFDDRIPAGDSRGIVLACAAALGLYAASTLVALLARGPVSRATKDLLASKRAELAGTVQSLPRSWHDRRQSADLHALLVLDTENVDRMATQLANTLIPAIVISSLLSLVALALQPLLFGVLLLSLPPLLVASHRLGRRTRLEARANNAALRAFSASTLETLRASQLTKAHGADDLVSARHAREAVEVAEAGRRLMLAQGAQGLVQGLIAASAGVFVLMVGGVAVAEGTLSIGELLAFYAVVALLLRQLNSAMPGLAALPLGLESLARTEALLRERDSEREPYTGLRAPQLSDSVRVEGAVFGYASEPVLRGVDLTVRAGEVVALTGPNGGGKTTLASLICGLYRPWEGRVLADGVPYDDIDIVALRRQIGVVLQEPFIVGHTIRDVLSFGRSDAGDEALLEAAEAAGAAALIGARAGGLSTPVGDEGVRLSGGQRQRLAIARALVGQPRLLLLDEPTTYLDDSAVAALLESLAVLPWRPGILMITHDAAVAAHADRLVHLREGRTTGAGALVEY